jgi:hypothetical protein
MLVAALQPISAWAEDRATLRSDLSADPGTKTEGGGTMPSNAADRFWSLAIGVVVW